MNRNPDKTAGPGRAPSAECMTTGAAVMLTGRSASFRTRSHY